ncbi:hypothetical protein KP79_PYT26003 [Mizuhopecten yessoensis]|uniref:L-Fucosyltransferase n=1 Tax=Mizuhopecten yessoensis TaxID=6573 RepID=A0A210PJP0_MIZYE|nr:hypothetical protein KP79_PYT26003 [Mizuhopecten yessoensis]
MYFKDKHKNVKFLVSSDHQAWTRQALGGVDNVLFLPNGTKEIDMATLKLAANHSIITVGTSGWWIAKLTNVETA